MLKSSLILLDIQDVSALPAHLAPILNTTIRADQFGGLLDHPGELIDILDQGKNQYSSIVIVSDGEEPLNFLHNRWALGARCNRNLSQDWIPIIAGEALADTIYFVGVSSSKCHVFDSSGWRLVDDDALALLRDGTTDRKLWITRRDASARARFRDTPFISSRRLNVWHGSATQSLRKLRVTSGSLWVSTVPAFAACFVISPYSNEGFFQGIDCVSREVPVPYLVIPGHATTRLEAPCSLYRSESMGHLLMPRGIEGYEYIVSEDLPVLEELTFLRASDALQEFQIEFVCSGSSPVIVPEFVEHCKRYRFSIEAFVGMPVELALRLKCKSWAIKLWLLARGKLLPQTGDDAFVANAICRMWMSRLGKLCTLPEYGYHSVEHLCQTAKLASSIALAEKCNIVLAACIGLFHDIARTGDHEGDEHGRLGRRLVEQYFQTELSYLFSPVDLQSLFTGVEDHPSGTRAENKSVGAAWDADRMRLAEEFGFDEKFFSTDRGRSLARTACSPHLS